MKAIEKLRLAVEKDPSIVCDRGAEGETLGSNPAYLEDILGLTKSDLIRLERKGLAIKARYEVARKDGKNVTGTHRTRWVIFKEALS